ncbi:hypothetical protein BOX15_Mlig033966g2 [Macrostomum lignano]|nr:hypothetical protein BOX15_Mlig033966g2 [Macrostomum lignano]
MPFWRAGVWHHTCIKYNDFGDFWCSLTANFTKDENWKRCRSPDLKRFQCHIPFEFEGKNHTSCLPIKENSKHGRGAHHSFWCATVPKIDKFSPHGTDWAYCEHRNATGVAYLKKVGPHKNIAAAKKNATVSAKSDKNATESAAAAAAAGAPGKALNGAAGGQGASGASGAGLSASATIGIAVGVVCSVLAVVAVVAGVAIRKRRRNGQHKALLQTREKGTYGGMEASN